MIVLRRLAAATAALCMIADMTGCAAYRTYTKCGLSGCAGDARVTSDVETLFAQHAVLQAPNLIDVHTLDGVVYLNGLVDTDLQRQEAESVALQAHGVRRVVNSIGTQSNR